MTKSALCLDMDDLIYPFMQTLVPFHNEHYGTSLVSDDYFSFWFEHVWGTDSEEAKRRVDECFAQLEGRDAELLPITGADVAIKELAERYRLYIVTSRTDDMSERSLRWLEHHFGGMIENAFFCNSYLPDHPNRRTKASVVEELDAVGLVDDSASHITEVVNLHRLGILFGDYAWNRNDAVPPQALRAHTWDEVTSILMGDTL